jgi:hypothetical protein
MDRSTFCLLHLVGSRQEVATAHNFVHQGLRTENASKTFLDLPGNALRELTLVQIVAKHRMLLEKAVLLFELGKPANVLDNVLDK